MKGQGKVAELRTRLTDTLSELEKTKEQLRAQHTINNQYKSEVQSVYAWEASDVCSPYWSSLTDTLSELEKTKEQLRAQHTINNQYKSEVQSVYAWEGS